MTKWDALPKELRDLFNEVTCGPGSTWAPILKEAIRAPFEDIDKGHFYTYCVLNGEKCWEGFAESCWNFVHYQVMDKRMCNGNFYSFLQEGFHIGSPWHGDVLRAPILFLSDNPGVTFQCLFPRWHPVMDIFTLGGGKLDKSITYTDDLGNFISLPNRIMPEEGIYDFLSNRFARTYIDGSGNPDAWIIQPDDTCAPKPQGVLFWKGMRDFMEQLVGNPQQTPQPRHTRKLMKSVLSSEIIPFGSQDQFGAEDDDIVAYYWDNFVVKLLKHCGAKILVLVGGKTRKAYLRSLTRLFGIQSPQLATGVLYDNTQGAQPYCNKDGESYQVVTINHFSYHYHRDGQEPQNYPAVVDLLKAEAKAHRGGLVDKALAEVQKLYASDE